MPPFEAMGFAGLPDILKPVLVKAALGPFLCVVLATAAQNAAPRDQMRANAITLARQGRYPEAARILKGLVESDPKDLASLSALAELDYRFGYYDAALMPLAKILELRPDDTYSRTLQAVCLFKVGNGPAATKLTEDLLSQTPPPNDIDLTLTYAQYLYEHGNLDKALTLARSATQFAPQHPIGFFWLARLLLEKGQIKAAAEAAEQSVALGPQLPYARNLLIRIYRLQGRTDDAERQAEWVRTFEARKAGQ